MEVGVESNSFSTFTGETSTFLCFFLQNRLNAMIDIRTSIDCNNAIATKSSEFDDNASDIGVTAVTGVITAIDGACVNAVDGACVTAVDGACVDAVDGACVTAVDGACVS